ncbi:hypothetical protein [Marivirga sp.]|uniref:hypothetical protein n=1 Tax=Marivirga sp. TaxID=2018662 RepID=UPI0026004A9F|nr:hypothetical protein [Marivirga sp.]
MKIINFKILLLLSSLSLYANSLSAQEIAITERGDSVVLLPNGTWDYFENYVEPEEIEIGRNDSKFLKPKNSSQMLKGLNNAYQLWYNPSTWKRVPAADLNPDADLALKMKRGDVYAMVIYEELEIEVEKLMEISFQNANSMSPDFKIVSSEYRFVNDKELIFMQMEGTVQSMKISYISYYASGKNGSFQFHIYTGQKLVDKYKEEIFNLLNGLIIK